jgi:hypothetical protein
MRCHSPTPADVFYWDASFGDLRGAFCKSCEDARRAAYFNDIGQVLSDMIRGLIYGAAHEAQERIAKEHGGWWVAHMGFQLPYGVKLDTGEDTVYRAVDAYTSEYEHETRWT